MTLKALEEKRAELQQNLEGVLAAAETENRAMSTEESAEFDRIEAEIRAIDETIARKERMSGIAKNPAPASAGMEERAEQDAKNFLDFIAGRATEMRAEGQMDLANNGAIIPTSIANRIIKAVVDRCPILAGATRYNVKGTLKVPVWNEGITVGYQQEFTDMTASGGKFTSVDLSGYLAGALTLIGKSVINNASVNVLDFVIAQMAEVIAIWTEGQLLKGTGTSAATGALTTTNILTAASGAAITADELIALQAKVKQADQAKACWTMHPDTFTAIKQLKDGNDRYLLQDDLASEFPYRILSKPVHLSDNMPVIGAGANAILYGDYAGLSVNFRENVSIEVLREKYATQHALGIISWFEFDSKVTDTKKLAVLKMGG